MNATLNFEADKARLARAILNIDNDTILEKVKHSLLFIFAKDNQKSEDVTAQMINKYSGAWKDDRSDDEIINDIYSQRYSKKDTQPNPFDE